MSYIPKRCGPAGGLQSFVQQCIFNRASHEQEPYGPRQGEIDRKREESVGGEWWDGDMVRRNKREKKGEREVQVRQAVIDWCFVFVVPQCLISFLQHHWVPGGETTFIAQAAPWRRTPPTQSFDMFSCPEEGRASFSKKGNKYWHCRNSCQAIISSGHIWHDHPHSHGKVFFLKQGDGVICKAFWVTQIGSAWNNLQGTTGKLKHVLMSVMLGAAWALMLALCLPSLSLLCTGSSERGGQILPR